MKPKTQTSDLQIKPGVWRNNASDWRVLLLRTALEIQNTGHPVLVGERPDNPSLVVVQDATIGHQRPTVRDGDQFIEGGDAVPVMIMSATQVAISMPCLPALAVHTTRSLQGILADTNLTISNHEN